MVRAVAERATDPAGKVYKESLSARLSALPFQLVSTETLGDAGQMADNFYFEVENSILPPEALFSLFP